MSSVWWETSENKSTVKKRRPTIANRSSVTVSATDLPRLISFASVSLWKSTDAELIELLWQCRKVLRQSTDLMKRFLTTRIGNNPIRLLSIQLFLWNSFLLFLFLARLFRLCLSVSLSLRFLAGALKMKWLQKRKRELGDLNVNSFLTPEPCRRPILPACLPLFPLYLDGLVGRLGGGERVEDFNSSVPRTRRPNASVFYTLVKRERCVGQLYPEFPETDFRVIHQVVLETFAPLFHDLASFFFPQKTLKGG